MLARVASSLYWAGRYIERSEHLARYLRVEYFSILDAPMSQNKDFTLKSILNMYGMEFEADGPIEEQEVLLDVGLNPEIGASILSTVVAARENTRSFRYIISAELWEVINQYFHFVKEYDTNFYKTRGLYDFTISVVKHCAIIRSYIDHTIIHDDIWAFLSLGIHLERAAQILRILNSKLQDIEIITGNGANIPLKQYQWTITLKVLEGFDMHRRVYRKPQTQQSTFEFLITNSMFPRSIAYNLQKVHELVSKIGMVIKPDSQLFFKAGKLSSHFHYLEYSDIKDELQQFLEESLKQVYSLHTLISKEYFEV